MLPSKSSNKSIRKLERPRPLKWMSEGTTSPTLSSANELGDEVIMDLETLIKHLNNANIDNSINGSILKVCLDLKNYGGILESRNTVQLDRYFNILRNAARDERIDTVSRLYLLEIIELRASGWKGNENVENYYKNKLFEAQSMERISNASIPMPPLPSTAYIMPVSSVNSVANNASMFPLMSVPNPPPQLASILSHGEVLKSSGKYTKPTKIPAKNYFKDEIVIRNSDSGKVMGIKGRRVHMIEELSGTIVSFQRVAQGAKDRLVQITGPSEDSIGRARQLVEDTIRRNTSPIRDRPNPLQSSESSSNVRNMIQRCESDILGRPSLMHSFSMNDASIGEYQYTVNAGNGTLKLSGSRLDIVRTAKLVLEEYFAGDAKRTLHESVEDEDFVEFEDDQSTSDLPELTSPFAPLEEPSRNSHGASKPGAVWTERNGHRLSKSSRITGRCLSHDSTPESDEELYKKPSLEDDDEDDSDDNLEGKVYKTASVVDCYPMNGSKLMYVYTRDFLLECAKSPYSRSIPRDLPKIILEYTSILNKSSEFFDPVAYIKSLSSFSPFSSSGSSMNNRSGSWGSQDAEDEDAQVS